MRIIDYIKKKLGFVEDSFESEFEVNLETGENAENITEVLKHSAIRRADINVLDYKEREMYVRDKCDQMKNAAEEIKREKVEYQKVIERLSDIDELSALPSNNFSGIIRSAKKILQIEQDEENYVRPTSKITDSQYREMERMENEIPGIIKKIKDEEDYQMKVKRDLNLLEGEKGALAYQRREEKEKAGNCKALAFVFVFVSVMAALLLALLHFSLDFEVVLGYYIVLTFLCISMVIICVTYKNAIDSQAKTERKINRAITLQNSVKIKYVNATNLIDYYYSKYKINNSYELSYMWEKYNEEKNARNHSEEIAQKLDDARKELAKNLRTYNINDIALFVFQPYLLTDEMALAEIRKNLIIQRQKLKKGIDFNTFSLESSKREIEDLVREYPKFNKEILAIVSQYEEGN